jgi:hypothetical protein
MVPAGEEGLPRETKEVQRKGEEADGQTNEKLLLMPKDWWWMS